MVVQPDSFNFSGVDMRREYGIKVISYDVLKPPLRPRKVLVPSHDGTHDLGAIYHDERELRIECDALERRLTREQIRELAGLLDKKGRIYLWDEPDKYYIGQIYKAPNLRYLGMAGHSFALTFTCEPFAYGDVYDGPLPHIISYAGTARTPARLTITNTSNTGVNGVRIIVRVRKR